MIIIQKFFLEFFSKLGTRKALLKQWLSRYTLVGKFVGKLSYSESWKMGDFIFLYLLKKDMNIVLEKQMTKINKNFG